MNATRLRCERALAQSALASVALPGNCTSDAELWIEIDAPTSAACVHLLVCAACGSELTRESTRVRYHRPTRPA